MTEVLAGATTIHNQLLHVIAYIEKLIHAYFVPLKNTLWKPSLLLKTHTLAISLLAKIRHTHAYLYPFAKFNYPPTFKV